MARQRKINVPLIRLRELRTAENVTIQDLATKLDVPSWMVAAWESGRIPMPAELWHKALRLLGRQDEDLPLHGRMPINEAPEKYRVPSAFMHRLRTLRVQAGLTQTEFARLLGVKLDTITAWETGRSVMKDVQWYKTLKALDLPPEAPPGTQLAYDPDKEAKGKREKVKNIDPATIVDPKRLPTDAQLEDIVAKLKAAGGAYVDKPATLLAIKVAFAMAPSGGDPELIRRLKNEVEGLQTNYDMASRRAGNFEAELRELKKKQPPAPAISPNALAQIDRLEKEVRRLEKALATATGECNGPDDIDFSEI